MNLIIHIGIEKTGSSSIQTFLFENKKVLEHYGYGYIHTAGRVDCREISVAFMRMSRTDHYMKIHKIYGEEARRTYSERVKVNISNAVNSLRSRGVHTCVISSEHLSSRMRNIEEVSSCGSFLRDVFDDIKIVAYVRDQCKKVTSSYSTSIKSGSKLIFQEFLDSYLQRNNDFYDRKFLMWERVFGEDSIRLQLFDRKSFFRGDLIHDFLNLSEIQVDHSSLILPKSNANTSLSKNACRILRIINTCLPKNKLVSVKIRSCLIRILSNLSGCSLSLSKEDSSAIKEMFSESNEVLRRKYFSSKESLFK